MRDDDPFENEDIQYLWNFIYLIPVVGVIPSAWTLLRQQGNRQQRHTSRVAVTLGLGWVAGYALLLTGLYSQSAAPLTLLILNSVVTSSYFLVNFWLMVCLWQGKPLGLPGWSASGRKRARPKVRL